MPGLGLGRNTARAAVGTPRASLEIGASRRQAGGEQSAAMSFDRKQRSQRQVRPAGNLQVIGFSFEIRHQACREDCRSE